MTKNSEDNISNSNNKDGGVVLFSADDHVKGGGDVTKCRVRKEKCVVHGCEAKTVKISSQKWRWIESKKRYGYVTVKTSKILCKFKTKGDVVPEIVHGDLCTTVQQRDYAGVDNMRSAVGTDNPVFESESLAT